MKIKVEGPTQRQLDYIESLETQLGYTHAKIRTKADASARLKYLLAEKEDQTLEKEDDDHLIHPYD